MQANSDNKEDKEAEIAANRFLKLMEQEALYERIRSRGEQLKNKEDTVSEEEEESAGVISRGGLLPMLKWAAAACLVVGGLTFLWQTLDSSTNKSLANHTTDWQEMLEAVNRSRDRGTEEGSVEQVDKLIENQQIDSALLILDTLQVSARSTYLQGVIAYKNENYPAAIRYFQQSYDLNDLDYYESAYLNLISSYLKNGEQAKAQACAQAIQGSEDFLPAMQKKLLDMTK